MLIFFYNEFNQCRADDSRFFSNNVLYCWVEIIYYLFITYAQTLKLYCFSLSSFKLLLKRLKSQIFFLRRQFWNCLKANIRNVSAWIENSLILLTCNIKVLLQPRVTIRECSSFFFFPKDFESSKPVGNLPWGGKTFIYIYIFCIQ